MSTTSPHGPPSQLPPSRMAYVIDSAMALPTLNSTRDLTRHYLLPQDSVTADSPTPFASAMSRHGRSLGPPLPSHDSEIAPPVTRPHMQKSKTKTLHLFSCVFVVIAMVLIRVLYGRLGIVPPYAAEHDSRSLFTGRRVRLGLFEKEENLMRRSQWHSSSLRVI
jgi:hypothetical protein